MQNNQSRREFMQTALTTATALSLADQALSQTQTTDGQGIPTRPLGNTGERVSILCLGGWHIARATDEAESIRIMHAALDEGITFFDNAWDYHDGGSDAGMGNDLADGGRRPVRTRLAGKRHRHRPAAFHVLLDQLDPSAQGNHFRMLLGVLQQHLRQGALQLRERRGRARDPRGLKLLAQGRAAGEGTP